MQTFIDLISEWSQDDKLKIIEKESKDIYQKMPGKGQGNSESLKKAFCALGGDGRTTPSQCIIKQIKEYKDELVKRPATDIFWQNITKIINALTDNDDTKQTWYTKINNALGKTAHIIIDRAVKEKMIAEQQKALHDRLSDLKHIGIRKVYDQIMKVYQTDKRKPTFEEMFVYLGLTTGRRFIEILRECTYTPIANEPNKIHVSGLAKKGPNPTELDFYTLEPADKVIKIWDDFRKLVQARSTGKEDKRKLTNRFNRSVNKHVKKVLIQDEKEQEDKKDEEDGGEEIEEKKIDNKFTAHALRSMYAKIAFTKFGGMLNMEETKFIQQALGHKSMATSAHYKSIKVDDEKIDDEVKKWLNKTVVDTVTLNKANWLQLGGMIKALQAQNDALQAQNTAMFALAKRNEDQMTEIIKQNHDLKAVVDAMQKQLGFVIGSHEKKVAAAAEEKHKPSVAEIKHNPPPQLTDDQIRKGVEVILRVGLSETNKTQVNKVINEVRYYFEKNMRVPRDEITKKVGGAGKYPPKVYKVMGVEAWNKQFPKKQS